MSSDSDSSEDDERMKKLRESVVPISCLPGNGKVSQTTSSTPVETCAGSSKVAGQSRHAQSLKPSIRRKVYGDDGSENQSGLNLDAGAKERIARTLQKSLQSELVEERKFTITQNHEDEVDTGVRLFKKSPLVCSDGEKKVVEPAKKSNSRKKRTLSSSDSDSDDRAKMIDLVSVAVSADTIRMNSLTNNVTTSTNTDDVSEPVSQTGELDHSNTDSGPTSKKKKKKKKRKSEVTEVVSEVT